MKRALFLLAGTILFSAPVYGFETKAKNALLMDAKTGQILFEKDADVAIPPASMSKLMTVYIVFEALKDGRINLDDNYIVSENAWRVGGAASGGSTMFLNPRDSVKISDLLRGIIVLSGNDACITVAENFAGSENDFAQIMNQKAKELGLKHSTFKNSTGLPDPEHRMSAKDLATLARALIEKFPEYYSIFSEKEFSYNGISQMNRNPLFKYFNGADGLKTGHTQEAGYGLTGSVKFVDGRHIILVVSGLNSMKERQIESVKLANYSQNSFRNVDLVKKGVLAATVPVWLGAEDTVDVVTEKDYSMILAQTQKTPIIHVTYNSPVVAPVKKGDVLGEVVVGMGSAAEKIKLIAAKDVQKSGYFRRIKQIILSWF